MFCIQYDRIHGRFFVAEDAFDPELTEHLIRFNHQLDKIRGWLNLKRKTGKFSHGFLLELVIGSMRRDIHVHSIFDEIGVLEGEDGNVITKPPREFERSPLCGLWHKHYFQANDLAYNMLYEFCRDGDVRLPRIFQEHFSEDIDGTFLDKIIREITLKNFEQKSQYNKITGNRFIVFEKLNDGENYYLTLGDHPLANWEPSRRQGEWNKIRLRVDNYKKFDIDGGW